VNGSSLTFTTNAAITRQRQQTPMVGAAKEKDAQQSWAIAVDIAGALSK
jgi:hypothetical protein